MRMLGIDNDKFGDVLYRTGNSDQLNSVRDEMRKTMTKALGTISYHSDQNKNVTYQTHQSGAVMASMPMVRKINQSA